MPETTKRHTFVVLCLLSGTSACDSISPEELTRVQAEEWGAIPGYIFIENPEFAGFPVSVQIKESFFSDEKSYETWITREDKLAGKSRWLPNATRGFAENRAFAMPNVVLDALAVADQSDETDPAARTAELLSAYKSLESAETRDLKLHWPDEYREAIERGDLGFLHVTDAKVDWLVFRKGAPIKAGGQLASDMVNVKLTFSVTNSSTDSKIYIEDAFHLVDSEDALMEKFFPTHYVDTDEAVVVVPDAEKDIDWEVPPNTTTDFSLFTVLMPYSEAMEAQPTEIVNILRGIRFKVPSIPALETDPAEPPTRTDGPAGDKLRQNAIRDAYVAAVLQRIERNWITHADQSEVPFCEVNVTLARDLSVVGISFGDCHGSTESFRRSIETALTRASPLPQTGDPSLIADSLTLQFSVSADSKKVVLK